MKLVQLLGQHFLRDSLQGDQNHSSVRLQCNALKEALCSAGKTVHIVRYSTRNGFLSLEPPLELTKAPKVGCTHLGVRRTQDRGLLWGPRTYLVMLQGAVNEEGRLLLYPLRDGVSHRVVGL